VVQEDIEVASVAGAAVASGSQPWAVYLLECDGGSSYVGISPRPLERFERHRSGRGGAYTRARRPRALAAVAWFENRAAAAAMEPRLKALVRSAKLEWFRRCAPAMNESSPATLAEGLASLAPMAGRPSTG
jgi:putative endonuclease